MSLEWMLIRGSGFVALALLGGSVVWGLLLSLKMLPRSAKALTSVHEALSVGALLATVVHLVALWTHDYLEFTVAELLVPGLSDWRPVAVAWGVVAFYGMVLVTVSFYLRSGIGQRYWRLLHFASFGVFAGSVAHGLLAGTDSAHPVVVGGYVVLVASVLGLVAVRLASVVGRSGAPATDRGATRPS